MSDFGKTVYRVELFDTAREQTEYYFGSLAAIYDVLTDLDIGCKLSNLWQVKIDVNEPYVNKRCKISKGVITRKKRSI